MFENEFGWVSCEGIRLVLWPFGLRFGFFDIDLRFLCQTRGNAELELFHHRVGRKVSRRLWLVFFSLVYSCSTVGLWSSPGETGP